MSAPSMHLSFVGSSVVFTVDGRTYTLEQLKAMGLVTAMNAMFVDRLRTQLLTVAAKLPEASA